MKGIKSSAHTLLGEEQAMADLLPILTIVVENLLNFAVCMKSLELLWIYLGAEVEFHRINNQRKAIN